MLRKQIIMTACLSLKELQRNLRKTKEFFEEHIEILEYVDKYEMSAYEMFLDNCQIVDFDVDANIATCIDILLCNYETELQIKSE